MGNSLHSAPVVTNHAVYLAGMEGEVKELLQDRCVVRLELIIYGRPVPVELEYSQVEHV